MLSEKRYDSIDGMRVIGAVLVSVLHVGMPLGIANSVLADIARIAVPFFFMCSGFFMYSPDYKVIQKRAIKGLKKTAKLLIVSTFIYLIIEMLLWQDIEKIQLSFSNYLSSDFLFFNATPFMPVGWYLSAYIYVLVIVMILAYFFPKPNVVWMFIIFLLLVYWMITGAYQHLIFDSFVFSLKYGCCWIIGLAWVMIGMVLSYYVNIRNIQFSVLSKWKFSLPILIGCMILCLAEHFFIKSTTGTKVVTTGYIGTILGTLTLFIFLLTNNNIFFGGGT